jgi:hypothetical protein
MSGTLAPQPRQQYLDSNGNPYVGAKLFTYLNKTTTKLATYSDNGLTVAHSNPIVLDAAGRPPAEIWLSDNIYTFVLAPATDTDPPASPILTDDDISGINNVSSSLSLDQWVAGSTPTQTAANKFTLLGDQTIIYHAGRRLKLVLAGSTLYGTIISSVYTSLTTITVHLDSSALDATLSAVSYGITSFNNTALPRIDDRRNLITNGDFKIWQLGATITSPATTDYLADMWLIGKAGAAEVTVTQSIDIPTVAQAGIRFYASLKVDMTTADAAIAAGDFLVLTTRIEGYDFVNAWQRPLILSFWAKGPAGTYCIGFRNGGLDRSFVAEYTLNAANTWEYKTVQVLAAPSAGTWYTTNLTGIQVDFALAAGATWQTTAGAWQTGSYIATSNQVNFAGSVANDFFITGVQLLPGSVPRLFSDALDYEATLSKCMRYYEIMTGEVSFDQPTYYTQRYKVKKRTIPTITVTAGGISTSTITGIDEYSFRFENIPADSLVYDISVAARL